VYTRVAGPCGSSVAGGGAHSGAAGRSAGGAFSSRVGSLEIARSAGGLTRSGASAAPGRASDSTLRKPFTSGCLRASGRGRASGSAGGSTSCDRDVTGSPEDGAFRYERGERLIGVDGRG
jgi:hypothetical protein